MISVVTPSVRPELLPIVYKCLCRQTYSEYEWLVASPTDLGFGTWVAEPPKREGDYYGLNKAWNAAFRVAKGSIVVSIVDGLWFPPDILEKLWSHYIANPKACVGAVGDQYDKLVDGKPEHCVWQDPRKRTDLGSFYEINPNDLELCIASLPLQGIKEVGGVDEEYDRYAALSEKEMCYRMDKMGYKFYLDQGLEYRAIKHPRLNEKWDERYNAGCEVYARHRQEIAAGTRLKLNYL